MYIIYCIKISFTDEHETKKEMCLWILSILM